MKQILTYSAIVIFAIFVGSQITEGVLLVPFWKSMTSLEFYAYYNKFGSSIGRFYTVLTITAALIAVGLTVYYKVTKSEGFKYALISSCFALLFIAAFYVYFKSANEHFYSSDLSEESLKIELLTWTYWHWGRVIIEMLSMIFLIMAINRNNRTSKIS